MQFLDEGVDVLPALLRRDVVVGEDGRADPIDRRRLGQQPPDDGADFIEPVVDTVRQVEDGSLAGELAGYLRR